jgi:hypothetical protein
MYLFGDSTPFPLTYNFLDTLVAAVDSAAQLFRASQEVEAADQRITAAQREAGIELDRLESLQRELMASLSQAAGDTAAGRAAQAIAAQAKSLVQRSKVGVTSQRAAAIRRARSPEIEAGVRRALARFWLVHELPGTQWSLRWKLGRDGAPRCELRATAGELVVNLLSTPRHDDLWAGPIDVFTLLPALSIEVPIWTRRIKGTRTRAESLADYAVVEVEATSSRRRMVLRKRGKNKDRLALLVTLSAIGQERSTVALIDEQHDVLGDAAPLSQLEVEDLERLWSLVLEHDDELLATRSEMVSAFLGNGNVENVRDPARLAEHMLHHIAPLVREIRMRSRVPGELILKQQIDHSRREELFLSRQELHAKFADLHEAHQRVFDAMGLGTESTTQFASMLKHSRRKRQRSDRSQRVVSSTRDAIEAPASAQGKAALKVALMDTTPSAPRPGFFDGVEAA